MKTVLMHIKYIFRSYAQNIHKDFFSQLLKGKGKKNGRCARACRHVHRQKRSEAFFFWGVRGGR